MAFSFDPSQYGAPLADLIGNRPTMPLHAGDPDRSQEAELALMSVESVFAGQQVVDRGAAECCLAGVWLLHGFLDEAHAICQDIPSRSGSYWHGVMHRREGDYGNACYWFRRAGDHPAGELIASVASGLPETSEAANDGTWQPAEFVRLVERATRSDSKLAQACQQVQQTEWEALFDTCYRDAIGK